MTGESREGYKENASFYKTHEYKWKDGLNKTAKRTFQEMTPNSRNQTSNPSSKDLNPEDSVSQSINYLASEDALRSVERDPYWPKWNSPWWHMTLLWELGLASRIPKSIAKKMVEVMNSHFLKFFPVTKEEIPEGADPRRQIPCHCALGTIYQVLSACGIDVDVEVPWVRRWFLKYQLPDGGLNCDESAYTKANPKSSIISTLPPLEAILLCTPRPFTTEEVSFLDRGADYLVTHKLFRSAGNGGQIINHDWIKVCFPRFYEYDILRGLTFLVKWSQIRGKSLSINAIQESIELLQNRFPDGHVIVERAIWNDERTLDVGTDGKWIPGCPASHFELLSRIGKVGQLSFVLTEIWQEILIWFRKNFQNNQ